MACRAVERWSLISLVGAYLDLALAYLFLVGATIAFFASKLLSLAGLSLPCSCDGRFGHPACAQTALLLDFPTARLASAHHSLRSRFPFDSLLPAGASSSSPGCCYGVRRPSEDANSCCSVSSLSSSLPRLDPMPEEPLAKINVARSRSSPGDSISDHEKPLSASAERISGGPWDSDDDVAGLGEDAEAGEEKDSLSGVIGWEEKASLAPLRSLERELQEERGARSALYQELEKERSAAASAADEAMSMILRLQKEKAEIDMEARQYQRMIEEKYAYDAEEMEILKEIIVRRERENHVLEKEVQMFKQMINSGGSVEQAFDTYDNVLEDKLDTLVDSSDDPLLMLQQIYKSIGKKEHFGVESTPFLNSSTVCSNHNKFVDVRNHSELFNSIDDCDQEFQEKSILATDNKPSSSDYLNSICAEGSVLYNLNTPFEAEYLNDITDLTLRDEDERDNHFDTSVPSEGLHRVRCDATNQGCNEFSQLEVDSSIFDVHVIDRDQVLQIKDYNNQIFSASEKETSCTNFNDFNGMGLNIRRSCSEITNRIGLIDNLSGRTSIFNLRSSLPSVENKRYKLENEVEGLRNRLEIIRQGREKLSLCADQNDKETFQLQLLDEIACQLKEIKKVTEPITSLRRVSLPPSSSMFKVGSDM